MCFEQDQIFGTTEFSSNILQDLHNNDLCETNAQWTVKITEIIRAKWA